MSPRALVCKQQQSLHGLAPTGPCSWRDETEYAQQKNKNPNTKHGQLQRVELLKVSKVDAA